MVRVGECKISVNRFLVRFSEGLSYWESNAEPFGLFPVRRFISSC